MSPSEYVLLIDSRGHCLRIAADGSLGSSPRADDSAIWGADGDGFIHATSGERYGRAHLAPYSPTTIPGPNKLPSQHLLELSSTGVTVLGNVMSASELDGLQTKIGEARARDFPNEEPIDGNFWIYNGLAFSSELARAATHPVALWLMEQYLGTNQIYAGTPPMITTIKPAVELAGTYPEGGWHTDYPYHRGVFPQDRWPENPPFGLQYNVCIDPFRADNAATQYLPGSHRLGRWPDAEFNRGGTRMGFAPHQDVRQLEAPAGAALIYDSRTWHRSCNELNHSGNDRSAILNAITPAYVPLMIEKDAVSAEYRTSGVADQLSERERADIERLHLTPTAPLPPGMAGFGNRHATALPARSNRVTR